MTISPRLTRRPGFAAGLVAAFILSLPAVVRAQALPAGWSVADVGAPAAPGSATLSSSTFSISSRGFDVNGAADQFTFVYTSVKGDITLIAKLSALQNTDPWSQAGLMIRDSLYANSNQAFVFATPGNGVVFRSRTSSKGGTNQTAGGAGMAPVWLRIDRKPSAVTAYRSTDGVSWTTVATLKARTNQTLLVGFAVASHTAAASVTTTLSSVSLNGLPVPKPATPQNNPPSVSLISPAGGAILTAPASIAMSATAADSDGSVAKVDFYSGTTRLGSDSTSPYSFTWLNVPLGSYSVSAVARDNLGATAVSSWSDITVGAGALSTAFFSPAVVPDSIDYYVFEVFAVGSDPFVAAPIATQNLGLPTVVDGECVANVQATILALAPGSYIATVSSVSPGEGALRSAPFAFTR